MLLELLNSLSHVFYMALHVVNAGSFPRPLTADKEHEYLEAYRKGGDNHARAVNTFDYTKGTRLATYASRCIENEILMFFRSTRKTAQDVSMDDPIDTDKDGHPLTLMDVIAEEDNTFENLDLKINSEKLYRYIAETLDDREKEIIELRYGLLGDGLTQREVASRLNISRSYVSRIEKKALDKLKRRFDAGDGRKPVRRIP